MKSRKRIYRWRHAAALAAVALSIATLSIRCGRKGALYLEPRPEPPMISQVTLRQVGTRLEVSWAFPPVLADGKQPFDTALVRWVRIYHADHHIPGDAFQRRATALAKILLEKLTRKGEIYSISIPFKPGELSGKKHFFALRYGYLRYKSPFSPVKMIATAIPSQPVPQVKAIQEEKTIRLLWKRPDKDLEGKPQKNLSGYSVQRRILPLTAADSTMEFATISPRLLLEEKYTDADTSREGRYEYRITAHYNAEVESDPSESAVVTMRDLFAPDSPAGVVVFRAKDHLLLNWRPVRDGDFSHFRIYRRVDGKGDYRLLVDRQQDTHYEDRSVKNGHTYAYQVTAVDDKGNESDPSDPVDEAF